MDPWFFAIDCDMCHIYNQLVDIIAGKELLIISTNTLNSEHRHLNLVILEWSSDKTVISWMGGTWTKIFTHQIMHR